MKYLLPCSCGERVPVEVSQAGQTVVCSCGTQLEVPGLRMIRQLKPARDDTAEVRAMRSGNWSLPQRLLFAFGLATAVAGLSIGLFFQLARGKLDTKETPWDIRLDTDLKHLENMNLEEAWENWIQVRDSGIGPYAPPDYIRSRMISDDWKGIVLSSLGVGAVGIALMGIAVLLPRRKATPPRKRPPARK